MTLPTLYRILVAAIVLMSGSAAWAQMSLDDIEASVGGLSKEMERVEALLSDPDANRRLAAMELLIKSGNPQYGLRAREVGLFSSDEQMRRVAVKAVLDSGGPFRFDFELQGVDESTTGVRQYITNWQGGSLYNNDTMGQFLVSVLPYNEEKKCWATQYDCVFVPSGNLYIIPQLGPMTGTMQLSAEGTFVGEGSIGRKKTVNFTISLVE